MLKNPKYVTYTPVATLCLLEGANMQQLFRIWTEWTAQGQSLGGWICVTLAVALWLNYYKVMTPEASVAIWATRAGVVMNASVAVSVFLFRYVIN